MSKAGSLTSPTWGNKRADATVEVTVTGRLARNAAAGSAVTQQSNAFYLSLQLFPVRPPPIFFATALQEKPAPCVPPSSRMTLCSLWSS